MAPLDAKIADRVRKLMRLGESPNENEAASAAAEAARLMTKYGIEMSQLKESADDSVAPVLEESVESSARLASWRYWLADGAIKSQGGDCWQMRTRIPGIVGGRVKIKSTTHLQMVGTRAQIDAAQYIYQAMTREVERLANVFYAVEARECEASGVGVPSARTWKNSFRLGCAVTIGKRLAAQYQATLAEVAKEAPTGEQALVHVRRQDKALAAYRDAQKLRTSRPSRVGSVSGYAAGKAAGADVSLGGGKGLGAPAPRLGGRR